MIKVKKKIKIFISYSHEDKDKEHVNDFNKHINPLREKYSLEIWFDEKNKPGSSFMKEIDEHLKISDIVCLFISADFLESGPCKKEIKQALKLKKEKRIIVIPIILSTCGWKETELKGLLAIPKDGKPVDKFQDKNEVWQDISNAIKIHIEDVKKMKEIKITNKFKDILQDTEILTKAHHNKENILVDDIFVAPQLECYDKTKEYEDKDISYEKLEKDIIKNNQNIVIVGDNQSGKTTLCKRLFITLKEQGKLPVYIFDKDKKLQGEIENRIEKSFKEQYDCEIEYLEIKDRIIPIIDDFHRANNKQKHIEKLEKSYPFSILVIDDISDLNIKNKEIVKKFKHFKIKEFSPSLRNKLIKKWQNLDATKSNENEEYKKLDEKTELVNETLGKIIGNGIIPSYPFFILTILSTYETANPLDENITSQGHCYQALIYICLRKEIDNKDVDIYLNFLTEISYHFFKEKKKEFTSIEIDDFVKIYKNKYNLPIKKETTLLSKLNETKILVKDSFENIIFNYDYLYFYFVAKYLAEHIDENKKDIDKIIANLHKNENAYIIIFIFHHSKDNNLLDEIVSNTKRLFGKYQPANLKKDDVEFLDKNISHIIDASLPNKDKTPESHRDENLKEQDVIEEKEKNDKDIQEEEIDSLDVEIRRTIKTVEVMGRIIKNRSGSLEKERLKEIFKASINANLRFLNSFFKFIKDKESQDFIIDFIKNRLEKITEKSKEKIGENKLKEIAKTMFWNFNFIIIYGIIDKTIHSLGSDNLIEITNKVCDEINTPASFLVKHGILMWYSKNLKVDNISKKIKEKDFSDTAEKIIKYMVVDHCSMQKITYKDMQKLGNKLKLPVKKLLLNSPKK